MSILLESALQKAKGKLNAQGLARRDKGLMSCILSGKDKTTVSIDLSAGEPSVTSHFSQDRNYLYACFEGVGKVPKYRGGILQIDDIYLMTMSVSPIGADKMREAFNAKWPAGSFQDQWMVDPEVIKTALKRDRQIHKILALGLGYGMGAKKMVKQMYDQGYILELKNAKAFHRAYWALFSGVKKFSEMLSNRIERDGYLINPFGYRLTPEPHKAFNYFIQSSVSGIMHVFTAKLMAAAPDAEFITCVHDELLIDVPNGEDGKGLERFRQAKDRATDSLNEDLNWSVKIRTGFAPGKNWYEAK